MSTSPQPMFNFSEKLPAYLGGLFIAIELLMYILPQSLQRLSSIYGVLRPIETLGATSVTHAVSLIGHGFFHADWSHVLINTAMIIIFGIITLRAIKLRHARARANGGSTGNPNVQFGLIFLAGVIVGGIFQWGWWSISGTVTAGAVGASGGASALFATSGWALGGRLKMVQFGMGWTLINIVLVVAEPIFGVSIAWAAHIGGYVAGMILAPLWVKPNSTGFKIT